MTNVLLESFNPTERLRAEYVEGQIQVVAEVIGQNKKILETNYVKLGSLINEVREKKYWLLGNYNNFGEYLQSCEKKFDLGHSQLYAFMSVSRNLLPSVDEDKLYEMGITKASVLSKYVEQSGSSIPQDLLDSAVNPKTKTEELKGATNLKLHNILPDEKGKWFDFGGFYATIEEVKEINQAIELAKNLDPVISRDLPNWIQLKEVLKRFAQEFLGAYS